MMHRARSWSWPRARRKRKQFTDRHDVAFVHETTLLIRSDALIVVRSTFVACCIRSSRDQRERARMGRVLGLANCTADKSSYYARKARLTESCFLACRSRSHIRAKLVQVTLWMHHASFYSRDRALLSPSLETIPSKRAKADGSFCGQGETSVVAA